MSTITVWIYILEKVDLTLSQKSDQRTTNNEDKFCSPKEIDLFYCTVGAVKDLARQSPSLHACFLLAFFSLENQDTDT
jgi:hypothetical protein